MNENSRNECCYLGKIYPIHGRVDETAKKISIIWTGKSFICISPQSGSIDLTAAMIVFYKKEMNKIIKNRLDFYVPSIKQKYKSVKIVNSKNKWGSCDSMGNLTFHWKLAVFPIEVIDYVVVHELCHLVHMNHGRSFWRLVGKIKPNYKELMPVLGTKKVID